MNESTVLSEDSITGNRKLTPMLQQYMAAKKECPGAILMFRMGDFYELFFEDAKIAARVLDLTLTARDKSDDPIPMAGVPHHAVTGYIARLVEKGHSVAICDQVEDPRFAKGIVKREITRLITPGTVTDFEALDPGSNNYLAYVAQVDAFMWAIALCDMLSGELLCTHCSVNVLADELQRMGVKEILVEAAAHSQVVGLLGERVIPVRVLVEDEQAAAQAPQSLIKRFATSDIEGLPNGGTFTDVLAVYRLLQFIEQTQKRELKHIMRPRVYRSADFLALDEATRRNLELMRTGLEGKKHGTLLWHLDRCRTAVGSRLLAQWMCFPLRDIQAIEARYDCVQALKENRSIRVSVQKELESVRDIERLLGRVAVGRAGPRDLLALRESLGQIPKIKQLLQGHVAQLNERWVVGQDATPLYDMLLKALVDDPPVVSSQGGIFKRGFNADLDELITLSTEGHEFLADLEKRERDKTGITSLKVRFNKVFGYYIEITKANLQQVPAYFIRKQTLVNAERFITAELKEFEDKVLSADERRKSREQELFNVLVEEVGAYTKQLRSLSRLLAETDAYASLAQVAEEGRYVRPHLCREPVLHLEQARHPVIERLMPHGERFVPNDVNLDTQTRQLIIVTGPNMAGKSTVMRQTALCVLMAQMGAFVPAKQARIGVCDRLFTRVGASDNLSRGQSTFMVEMSETAAILEHATAQSVVLLDEIGRGTSTFDGVSIAWAVAEHIHDATGCRAMFATHYHELTELAALRPRIINMSVAVKEQNDSVVFLRRLVEGPANRSYGIAVAQLAGLPGSVLARARDILQNLENNGSLVPARGSKKFQLDLFAHKAPPPVATPVFVSPVELEVAKLDIANTTPVQALIILEKLKNMASTLSPGAN